MSGERETAFYKGVKFWFALLLAALLAWMLLKHWASESPAPAQAVSNIR